MRRYLSLKTFDQQLGGRIMWIPGAVAYLIGALAVASRWVGVEGVRQGRPYRWPVRGVERLTPGKRT